VTYRAYAGIGSRRTPDRILSLMSELSGKLADLGWTLRTGGADGADQAFLTGTGTLWAQRKGEYELYLPWPGFNGHRWAKLEEPSIDAFGIAARFHSAWSTLKNDGVRALHARNVHQILGADLRTPSRFILCWTPDGADGVKVPTSQATGGTGQAIRIAVAWKIPVFNLRRPEHLARIREGLLKNPT